MKFEDKTKNGLMVRIYATDGVAPYPIHGAVYDEKHKGWVFQEWTKDGRSVMAQESGLDLIPVFSPKKGELVWVSNTGVRWKPRVSAGGDLVYKEEVSVYADGTTGDLLERQTERYVHIKPWSEIKTNKGE